MSEKVDCPLCSKTLSYAGLNKHMFSKNHISIWNAPSYRTRLQNYFASGAKNTIEIKGIFICFGCKTFTRKDVPHSCPNKAKTLEFIKSILDTPVRVPERKAPEPVALPVAPSGDEAKMIQNSLSKVIESLNRNLKTAQSSNDRLSDIEETLFECLTAYKKGTAFNFFMIDFQDSQPELAIDMMNRLNPKIESSNKPK